MLKQEKCEQEHLKNDNSAKEKYETIYFWKERTLPKRKIQKNLRPVSFISDMAQVQDALWVGRNSKISESYTGPG